MAEETHIYETCAYKVYCHIRPDEEYGWRQILTYCQRYQKMGNEKCPKCQEKPSMGILQLFQKGGTIAYDWELCKECFDNSFKDFE